MLLMKKNLINQISRIVLLFGALCCVYSAYAADNAPMPELHVDGRYLVDNRGNVVNLHGFAQTYSPWFNERGTKWNNYDVNACLRYNKEKIDQILAAGWKMNFVRLHMDPYWSNKPGVHTTGENDITAFDFDRFTRYLDQVFIPMAEYAVSKGLYVVMRPPGVCPEKIALGDAYQKYLIKVWRHVASHAKLKNHPNIMFELANEPINILGSDGTYGGNSPSHFESVSKYFQDIVDEMRAQGCNNILWIPGLGYQSSYAGFATYPIKGDNIGYAVHVYPGWYGSDAEVPSQELGGVMGGGYEGFQKGWDKQVMPVADFAPIMVTEMDWAPAKYDSSWGKSITGEAKGIGFGANFKYIADRTGNVSWLLFTGCELLAKFKDEQGNADTFLTDPEACPWPIYHWYKEYADEQSEEPRQLSHLYLEPNDDTVELLTGDTRSITVMAVYTDGHEDDVTVLASYRSSDPATVMPRNGRLTALRNGTARIDITFTSRHGETCEASINVNSCTFPLTEGLFNPSIWENGTFNEATHEVKVGPYGFAGWQYSSGIDLSGYKYCIAKLAGPNTDNVSFRLFDIDNYWSDPSENGFNADRMSVVRLNEMTSNNGRRLDPSHLYIIGFWGLGKNPFNIEKVYLTNSDDLTDAIATVIYDANETVDVYTVTGIRLKSAVKRAEATAGLPNGIYIIGKEKVVIRN